jgi:hypothetical protein
MQEPGAEEHPAFCLADWGLSTDFTDFVMRFLGHTQSDWTVVVKSRFIPSPTG